MPSPIDDEPTSEPLPDFRTVRPSDDSTAHSRSRTAAYDVQPELPITVTSAEMSIPEPDDLPPPVVIPGYKIMRVLGEGAMGVVYKAVQTGLKRTVALKMVIGERPPSKLDLARFLSEAEALASVSHPNVVPVYHAGDVDGRPFLAMEFLPGGNLEKWSRVDFRAGGRIDPKEAAQAILQVARGVAAVHAIGIVHRDLKPQNVLVAADGVMKVADFGLAKRGGSELTQIGAVMGTPAYMSPEQARGRTKFVGPQADVWAIGVILYEIVTGRRPFNADDAYGLLAEIATSTPEPPRKHRRNIPRDLERIILHCMVREPEGRYPTAAELATDLDRYLSGEPIHAHRAGPIERALRWTKRRPAAAAAWVFGLTAVGATVVGGSLAGLWLKAEDARKNADDAREALVLEQKQTVEALRAEQLAKQRESEARKVADDATAQERKARSIAEEATGKAQHAADQLRASRYGYTMSLAHFEYLSNLVRARELLAEAKPSGGGWEWDYLNRMCNGHILLIEPNAGRVNGVAYTAGSGGRLLSAHADGTVRLWDSVTGKSARTLQHEGNTGEVVAVASSLDAKKIATASADGGVRLWNASTDDPPTLLRPPGPRGAVLTVAVKADGTAVAAGGPKSEVTIWNPENPKKSRVLAANVGTITSIGYSSDGRWLAVAGEAGGVKVWEKESNNPLLEVPGDIPVTAVAVSSDSRLAIGKADGEVHLWDLTTDKRVSRFRAHPGGVWGLEFAADGNYLASGGVDRVVRLWGGRTGESVLTLRGHTGEVRGVGFDPTGRRIVSGAADGTIRVWDRDRPPEGWILETDCGQVNAMAMNDGKLAVAGRDRLRVATIRDTGPDEASWSVPRVGATISGRNPTRPEGELAVRFGPSGILVISERGELNVRPLDDPGSREVEALPLGGPVSAAAFATKRDLVALGRSSGQVALWDISDKREIASWQAHPTPIRVMSFGHDHFLLTGSADGRVKFWNVETLQEKASAHHGSEVLAAAVSPDGRWAVTGSADHTAKVWDTTNGVAMWTLRGHLEAVGAVNFSPDSRRVVTGGRDGMIKVWDVSTGYELLTLASATDAVTTVAFSPDGELLFAGRANGAVRILSGKPTARFEPKE